MSATDLATRPAQSSSLVQFTPKQVALLKRTICKPRDRDATNDELALFVGQAKRTGLDPFAKQIYAIFRYDRRAGREVMTIQIAIDGFRVIAERTGRYLGKVGAYWCGPDGKWREAWLEAGHPEAAKVIVRKLVGDHQVEIPAVAHWREYASDQGLWKQMPANQLAKCAEALALRQAFPNDLSGLYTGDEMRQADRTAQPTMALPDEVVDGEVIADEPAPLTKALVDELVAAKKACGKPDEWVRQQMIVAGVDEVPPGNVSAETFRMLTERQASDLLTVFDEAGGNDGSD